MPDRLPILVVDDDSQMLRTIGDILRFRGYDPVGAGTRWQRRRAEQALEESELRLRRMFACVSDAVFITDDDRRVIDANPSALSLAARSLDHLRGEPIDAVLEPVRAWVDVRSDVVA